MNKEDEDRQIRETRSLLQKAGQRNAPLDTVCVVCLIDFCLFGCRAQGLWLDYSVAMLCED